VSPHVAEGATPQERRALFRVVHGEPSDDEIAALTVVLAAAAAAPPSSTSRAPAVRGRWSDPSARFRTPLHPGPDAWRMSTWPR
jgi:hypothetical protein